jgi:hypothetical protein
MGDSFNLPASLAFCQTGQRYSPSSRVSSLSGSLKYSSSTSSWLSLFLLLQHLRLERLLFVAERSVRVDRVAEDGDRLLDLGEETEDCSGVERVGREAVLTVGMVLFMV